MERLEKTKKDVFFADNFSGGCLAADVFYMFFGLVRSPFRPREKQVFSSGGGAHAYVEWSGPETTGYVVEEEYHDDSYGDNIAAVTVTVCQPE